MADTVGMNNAPQKIRVADNGSDSAGVALWLDAPFSSVSSLQKAPHENKKQMSCCGCCCLDTCGWSILTTWAGLNSKLEIFVRYSVDSGWNVEASPPSKSFGQQSIRLEWLAAQSTIPMDRHVRAYPAHFYDQTLVRPVCNDRNIRNFNNMWRLLSHLVGRNFLAFSIEFQCKHPIQNWSDMLHSN